MGFQKPNLDTAYICIRRSLAEINSARNDGFTSSYCKQDLYLLKCWLEDEYNRLPTFAGEQLWEQQRLVQILKN